MQAVKIVPLNHVEHFKMINTYLKILDELDELDAHSSLGVIEPCPMYCKVSCCFMFIHFQQRGSVAVIEHNRAYG